MHVDAGHQIAYEDEDEEVLEHFLAGLKVNGAESKPLQNWRKSVQAASHG
jgi:hypothetical protein